MCLELDDDDLICEKHATGGDFIGTADRERIFGTHEASDNIYGMGGDDIIVVRSDASNPDTIVGNDDGGTIIFDPEHGILPTIESLGTGIDTIKIHSQVSAPNQFILVNGWDTGDMIVYDGEIGQV